jgi:hypothetical protein
VNPPTNKEKHPAILAAQAALASVRGPQGIKTLLAKDEELVITIKKLNNSCLEMSYRVKRPKGCECGKCDAPPA